MARTAAEEPRQSAARPRQSAAARHKRPARTTTPLEPPAAAVATARPRHAVFIDVENTSSESDLLRVLDNLKIERGVTEVTAVGNWRVVGQQLGRTLAQRGAHLVHSAPAPRVPDWSDLWIAVSAGQWLGRAAPGDVIDIVSDDRAFDAVGDAASRLGVAFRRISYRSHPAVAEREAPAAAAAERTGRRRRRRPGGGAAGVTGAPGRHEAARRQPVGRQAVEPAATAAAAEERHAASQEQIRTVIARLMAGDPQRSVNLDALTVALKAEGFQRPPGSPRLVTRLRHLKDVEVLPSGRVRLVGAAAEVAAAAHETSPRSAPPVVAIATAPESAEPSADEGGDAGDLPAARRRSRRRGGRRRGGRRRASATAAPAD